MSNPNPDTPMGVGFRVVRFCTPDQTTRYVAVCEITYEGSTPVDLHHLTPVGSTVAHLRATLTNMTAALDRPALTYDIQRMDFIPTVEETYP